MKSLYSLKEIRNEKSKIYDSGSAILVKVLW